MARRQTTTFSMSFLDVISCGFGAVVLFYTIISAQAGLHRIKENTDLSAESRRLEQEVLDGYKHLAELRNALDSTEDRKIRAAGLSREMLEKLRVTQEELSRYEHDTLARRESLERLKADLMQLEEGTRRLREKAPPESVPAPLDREQLVTLKVDGRRVLVLVDASASMLDETLVNVIRLRNMPPERRIQSQKWKQAVNTVEWIAARLPEATQFQVYAFDTAPRPVVEGTAGRWLNAKDAGQIESGAAGTAPHGAHGRLEPAERLRRDPAARPGARQRDPRSPTACRRRATSRPLMRTLVTAEQREDLMQEAVKSLPPSPPPVNIVLLPMEGDPSAPIYFWRLARATGGGFLSPARDWP